MATRRKRSTKSYPGYLERRGNGFRVTFTVHGERHKIRIETTDRDEAEKLARTEYDKLTARVGHTGDSVRRVRVNELLTAFEEGRLPDLAENTQRTYRRSLAVFREFFVDRMGDPALEHVGKGDVRSFLEWRARSRGDGGKGRTSGRTQAKDRATLSAIFAYGRERELCEANPVLDVSVPKSDPRTPLILSDTQFEDLLAECKDPMLHLYVLLLNETGLRCESEALQLRWEDLELEHETGFVRVRSSREHRTKGGRGRHVPMTARLRQALLGHLMRFRAAEYRGQTSPWVFHHQWARRRAKAGGRIGTLRRAFDAAVKRAGLPTTLHQHDLRHRRVTTWLARENVNAVLVKEAIGHADLRTTMGYTHLVKEHLCALVSESADTPAPGGDGVGTAAEKHA